MVILVSRLFQKRETAGSLVIYMYNDEFPSEICNPL